MRDKGRPVRQRAPERPSLHSGDGRRVARLNCNVPEVDRVENDKEIERLLLLIQQRLQGFLDQ